METNVEKRSCNLGPGAMAESSMDKDTRSLVFGNFDMPPVENIDISDFILSNDDWLVIQCYVAKTQALPHTKEKFKDFFKTDKIDLKDFDKIIYAYERMYINADKWQTRTFPATVSLASDVCSYSLKVETYYAPILPLAEILINNPDDKKAKDKLNAIIATLRQEANVRQGRAAEVVREIEKFANVTKDDRIRLSGVDGKSGLVKYYADKYGSTSEEAKKLAKDISKAEEDIRQANKEYTHDVVVASTSPSYCWICLPFGLIAAAAVSGVYGSKAVKALDKLRSSERALKLLQTEEQDKARLLLVINSANMSLTDISEAVDKALPLVQKIQGTWQGIADDLNAIEQAICENIGKALPIIMDLGVETAIKSWIAVAKAADKYRQNAFITIQPTDVA